MAKKDEVVVFKSVGGVDEDNHRLSWNPTTSLLDVEIVHLQCDNNLVKTNEQHFLVIAIQAHKWKPDNKNSICLGSFVVNDNFPIDIKNPQEVGSILNYKFILCRRLIKYNKMNNIIPMKLMLMLPMFVCLQKKS
jgi:hypothetical protein